MNWTKRAAYFVLSVVCLYGAVDCCAGAAHVAHRLTRGEFVGVEFVDAGVVVFAVLWTGLAFLRWFGRSVDAAFGWALERRR